MPISQQRIRRTNHAPAAHYYGAPGAFLVHFLALEAIPNRTDTAVDGPSRVRAASRATDDQ